MNLTPRVHGNGFIQLPITERTRLHIWPYQDERLKVQETYTGIHSHRFGFKSMILKGTMLNRKCKFILGGSGSHRLWVPSKSEMLDPTDVYGELEVGPAMFLKPGEEYRVKAGEIHEAVPHEGPAVTIMTKLAVESYPPVVVIPTGVAPDNVFDRDLSNDPEVLWDIIRELI